MCRNQIRMAMVRATSPHFFVVSRNTLDELGDVQVEDIAFHSEVTDGEDDLSMTVYYHEEQRRR
jgi:hypothetical protein